MSNVAPNPNSGVGNANIKPQGSLDPQAPLSHDTSTSGGQEKVGFKAQVEGYAKKFAGKTFGNEKEVAQGEARLNGEEVVGNNTLK
ncbi:hypothetical protein DFH28DRAFT_190119 [Melampsora americana]|nr:hypothetical protein DFH28DRAFT_190119 [Melampsora americana]